MSIFRKHGVRCDWCGKFSSNKTGEYVKPDGSCGYIRRPEWHFNEDRSDKPEFVDNGDDICDECAAGRCVFCGSDQLVRLTPSTPGPDGWGWRCKACGKRWDIPSPSAPAAKGSPLPRPQDLGVGG